MIRGEIWTLSGGGEFLSKPRPAVIVQDDRFDATGSVVVCALTSLDTGTPYFRLLVEPNNENGLRATSWIMVDKIAAVPRSKVGRRVGQLSGDDMARLDQALLVFLGLAARPRRRSAETVAGH